MQKNWSESGWELLKVVAFNAAMKSGFHSSAEQVVRDAIALTERVVKFPESGQSIENAWGDIRYYSVFNAGKVAVWRIKDGAVLFVGAYASLPNPLIV